MLNELMNVDCNNRQQVIDYLNHLIQDDFGKLVQLLYRLDINETRLKLLLSQNSNEQAACIIADLIIERQKQKELTRKLFKQSNEIASDERW